MENMELKRILSSWKKPWSRRSRLQNKPENHSDGTLENTLCLQDNTSSALPTEITKESKHVDVKQQSLNKKLYLLNP